MYTGIRGFQEVLFVFDFNKPNIEMTESSEDKRFGRFVAEPLERVWHYARKLPRRIMFRRFRAASVRSRLTGASLNSFHPRC